MMRRLKQVEVTLRSAKADIYFVRTPRTIILLEEQEDRESFKRFRTSGSLLSFQRRSWKVPHKIRQARYAITLITYNPPSIQSLQKNELLVPIHTPVEHNNNKHTVYTFLLSYKHQPFPQVWNNHEILLELFLLTWSGCLYYNSPISNYLKQSDGEAKNVWKPLETIRLFHEIFKERVSNRLRFFIDCQTVLSTPNLIGDKDMTACTVHYRFVTSIHYLRGIKWNNCSQLPTLVLSCLIRPTNPPSPQFGYRSSSNQVHSLLW